MSCTRRATEGTDRGFAEQAAQSVGDDPNHVEFVLLIPNEALMRRWRNFIQTDRDLNSLERGENTCFFVVALTYSC